MPAGKGTYGKKVGRPAKKKPTKAVPKGFHRMPNGKLMKGTKHPTTKKKKY